jgi:hypothetical protein
MFWGRFLLAAALLAPVATLAQTPGGFSDGAPLCANVPNPKCPGQTTSLNGAFAKKADFPLTFLPPVPLTQFHFGIGNASNLLTDTALAGDCTYGASGIVCTKTNNIAFAPSATTDTTNAANIVSGTLPVARLPTIPLANGGLGASQTAATANQIPVFPGASGAAIPTSATTWFDNAYCNTVGFLIVRTTGAWTCSRSIEANVQWWGAVGDDATDNCTPFTNAYNAVVAAGNVRLHIPAGVYDTTCLPTLSTNSISLQGDGAFGSAGAGGTVIRDLNTTGNLLNITAQYNIVSDIYFFPKVRKTSGFQIAIGLPAANTMLYRVRIDFAFNGISIVDSSSTRLKDVQLRFLLGGQGINYSGTAGHGSFGGYLDHTQADNPYPVRAISNADVKTWGISTAFSSGQVINNSGNVYQETAATCTSLGSGTGPAGFPSGSTPDTVFTNTIADGTCTWKFVMTNSLTWVVNDNFGYSLTMISNQLLDGITAFAMQDTANTGSSFPEFFISYDLETDHSFGTSIELAAGYSAQFTQMWSGSGLTGNCVVVDTNFKGEAVFNQPRISGCAQNGMLIQSGPLNTVVTGGSITNNSAQTNNTFHGVSIASNANHALIASNRIGANPFGGNQQNSGVSIGGGTSDFIVVKGNDLQGNVTNAINNGGPSGTHNIIEGNTPAQSWSTFASAPSCGSATITNTTSHFKNSDRVTYVEFDWTIAVVGTCTSILSLTLPNTPSSSGAITGRESGGVNNKSFVCNVLSGSATATCIYSDGGGTSFGVINERLVASGFYESASP